MRQLKITKSITNRDSSSLEKYLQDVGKEEMITAEEEVELAQRIKKGDRAALERLTKAMVEFIQSKPYPIEKNVYLIVQNFVEEKIIDKTMKLIDLIESKNKRLIPNTLVLEIE